MFSLQVNILYDIYPSFKLSNFFQSLVYNVLTVIFFIFRSKRFYNFFRCKKSQKSFYSIIKSIYIYTILYYDKKNKNLHCYLKKYKKFKDYLIVVYL